MYKKVWHLVSHYQLQAPAARGPGFLIDKPHFFVASGRTLGGHKDWGKTKAQMTFAAFVHPLQLQSFQRKSYFPNRGQPNVPLLEMFAHPRKGQLLRRISSCEERGWQRGGEIFWLVV